MSDWVRWLLVGLAVVLVLALLAYGRGERREAELETSVPSLTLVHTDGRLVI